MSYEIATQGSASETRVGAAPAPARAERAVHMYIGCHYLHAVVQCLLDVPLSIKSKFLHIYYIYDVTL